MTTPWRIVRPAAAALGRGVLFTCVLSLGLDTAVGGDATSVASPLRDEGLIASLDAAGLDTDPNAPWTADRITMLGLYFDPAIRLARSTAEVATDDAEIAAQRANPTFSLAPERVVSAIGTANPWTIVAALAIPLVRGNELKPRRAAAQMSREVAQLELGAAFWQSRSRSRNTLRTLLVAREVESLATANAQSQSMWAKNASQRLALGDVDRIEMGTAQSATAVASADAAVRVGQRRIAEEDLAAAVGLPVDIVLQMTLRWDDLHLPPAPETLVSENLEALALSNRLDMRVLGLQARIAEAAWREARAGRIPKFGITPTATYDRGDRKVGLGGDIEVPLFHGPEASIHRAQAQHQIAEAKLAQRAQEVPADVRRAIARYSAEYAHWRSLETSAASAREAEKQAQRALAVGESDRPSWLQAMAMRSSLELQERDALQLTLTALSALEDSVEYPLWPLTRLRDVRTQVNEKMGEANAIQR